MPHIELPISFPNGKTPQIGLPVGKSASCSKILPSIILSKDGRISLEKNEYCSKGSKIKRRVTSVGQQGRGEDEPALRIQVTLHQPLNWQASAESSDNRTTLSSCSTASNKNREKLRRGKGLRGRERKGCGWHCVLCSEKCKGHFDGEEFSTDEEIKENPVTASRTHSLQNRADYYRRRRRRAHTKLEPQKVDNQCEKHSSFVVRLKRSADERGRDPTPFPTATTTPPAEEAAAGEEEVMTWFKACANNLRQENHSKSHNNQGQGQPKTKRNFRKQDKENFQGGMGAGGSREATIALKSRSQSSSALDTPTNTTTSSSSSGHNHTHSHAHTNGLSTSIPSDLWKIQTAQSPKHKPTTARATRPHPKDKRLMAVQQGKGTKSGGGNRSKLYAVSCPDVAQQAILSSLQHQQYEPHPPLGGEDHTHPTLFILPPPEAYRNPHQQHHHQHHHQANCPLALGSGSREHLIAQSHPHLYPSPPQPHPLQPHPQLLPYTGGMSMSYQSIPNSYFVQQQHHPQYPHPHHIHRNHNRARVQNGAEPEMLQKRGPPLLEDKRSSSSEPRIAPELVDSIFPAFVIPENIFEVLLTRDQRGLGLSVTGGRDSDEKYPGLVRIKKVFPMSPASDCGRIAAWDVILQANGVPLTGLNNHEALAVLRTTPTETILTLCRPPPHTPGFCDALQEPSFFPNSSFNHTHQSASTSTLIPQHKSKSLSSLKIPLPSQCPPNQQWGSGGGEFELTLDKVGGSLGFTLRQEDNSVLGHYVRALVKEPALTDGRIQPGDRIIAVNGQNLSEMSHGEAINFLRQCPTTVHLRMWRDPNPTPSSPLSPTESQREVKTKPLRQEALDMLTDLKKQHLEQHSSWKHSLPNSHHHHYQEGRDHPPSFPATLPRRRPHPQLTPSPQVLSAALSRFATQPNSKGTSHEAHPPQPSPHPQEKEEEKEGERSSGSGESTPMGSTVKKKGDPYRAYHDLRSHSIVSTTGDDSIEGEGEEDHADGGRRKCLSFRQFTLHLDRMQDDEGGCRNQLKQNDSMLSLPNSCGSKFRAGQPKYQSAIIPSYAGGKVKGRRNRAAPLQHQQQGDEGDTSPTALSDTDIPSNTSSHLHNAPQRCDEHVGVGSKVTAPCSTTSSSMSSSSSKNLLKWKGVHLLEEEDGEEEKQPLGRGGGGNYLQVVDGGGGELTQRRSPDGREFRDCDLEISSTTKENGEQIFTVQLSRRWCSRLGFSLQGKEGRTYISAIYPDSVAAKDGRLRVGDEVVMVNGETIRDLQTCEVIDMMRKTRGIISITLLRKNEAGGGVSGGRGSGSDSSDLGLR